MAEIITLKELESLTGRKAPAVSWAVMLRRLPQADQIDPVAWRDTPELRAAIKVLGDRSPKMDLLPSLFTDWEVEKPKIPEAQWLSWKPWCAAHGMTAPEMLTAIRQRKLQPATTTAKCATWHRDQVNQPAEDDAEQQAARETLSWNAMLAACDVADATLRNLIAWGTFPAPIVRKGKEVWGLSQGVKDVMGALRLSSARKGSSKRRAKGL